MQSLYPTPIMTVVVNVSGAAIVNLPKYETNVQQSTVAAERSVEFFYIWQEFFA